MRPEGAARRILQQAERADAGPGALEWFLGPEAVAAADEVRGGIVLSDGSVWGLGVLALGYVDWCRYLAGGEADRGALGAAVLWFAGIHEQDPGQVPHGLRPLFDTLSGEPGGAATEPGFAYDGGVGVTLVFQQSRHPGALPIAEALLRHAVAGFGEGSVEQGICLSDLGIVLLYGFQDGAGRHVLSEAVDVGRAAVVCAPGVRDEQARRHGNLGYTLRHWAEAGANRDAIREAVAELRQAVELCTWNNPLRAQHSATLGSALCRAAGDLKDPALLSEGIALLRAALSEPDVVVPHRASFLSDLGVALIRRAMESGDGAELYEEGIAACRRAAATAPNPVERAVYLTNLGLLLDGRASRTGHPGALDDAYAAARDALEGAPSGHPVFAQAHFVLAHVLGSRHTATGGLADLDEAVVHARRGMASVPADDLRRRVLHGTRLADLLRMRAVLRHASAPGGPKETEGSEEPGELHEPITLLRGLGEEVPARSAERARVLLALGRCLKASGRGAASDAGSNADANTDTDADTDANEAVDCFRKCLALPPPNSDFEATARFELGAALARRAGPHDDAWQQGADEMLRGIDLLPAGDPLRWDCHAEYAKVLADRGDATSGVDLYEEAVRLLREVVTHPPYARGAGGARCRSNLGTVLAKLALRTGRVELFAEAVASHREAVGMTAAEDHQRVHRLGALGETLMGLAEFRSDPEMLKEGVEVLRAALAASGEATSDRAFCLTALGDALRTLARLTGGLAPIEESVRCHREAVAMSSGPPTPAALLGLANSLGEHYRHTRDVQRSDEAMRYFRAALAAEQPASANRGLILTGLGYAEWHRAVDSGDETLMDSAVGTLREAVTIVPKARIGMALTNLGGALADRARVTGNRVWLAEAVTVLRRAVKDSPPTAMERSLHLNNLAEALRSWYETVGDPSAADEAAALLREAMAGKHSERLGAELAAINLGIVLTTRARLETDPDVAGEARRVLEEGVAGLGEHHPSRCFALLNLADACVTAAHLAEEAAAHVAEETDAHVAEEATGAVARQALHRAVTATRESLAGTPESHPNHALAQGLLAQAQLGRAALGERVDLVEAARIARSCARNPIAPSAARLLAARAWGEASAKAGHHADALDGYAYAVGLLPSIAPRDLARADQEARLRISAGLASDAAALALNEGAAGRALALLEHGRGVLLAQGLENRADVSRLRDLDPALAAEFERIRDQLSAPPQLSPALHTLSPALRTEAGGPAAPPHDAHEAGVIAEARHTLARRWERLLDEIRELPGLDGFLRPPSVPELVTAAADGPVVVVNVSGYRCDALVVTADAGIEVVPLPDLTPEAALSRAAEFVDGIDEAYGGKGVDNAVAAMRTLSGTLGWLWDTVAAPVLDRLGLDAVPRDGAPWPRLWWCPTGWLSFLPLHAAGRGAPDSGTWVLDRAVSSYTPTLRALVRARDGLTLGAPARPSPLVVALAETPGAARLPGASREAALLAELFPSGRLLAGADATVEAVVQALEAHPWVHFSCHGVSELLSPSQSGLILYDGRLTVSDAAAQRPRSPELAVLSACSTSQGGVTLPDEAVQLTSSFQLAGYPHVIGTLWTVSDKLATRLTEEFYASLAEDVARGRPIDPAAALHRPVRSLRDRYAQAPHLWAAHIHTGP
ncbi:CHAT domain-containing protein [Streptomyces sp. P1-3]|uniref:CHAT domain-containing protein n=1 Tax=Streptomyces sp. P1-3 TaxID=3421658 RepID=UPI003D360914